MASQPPKPETPEQFPSDPPVPSPIDPDPPAPADPGEGTRVPDRDRNAVREHG